LFGVFICIFESLLSPGVLLASFEFKKLFTFFSVTFGISMSRLLLSSFVLKRLDFISGFSTDSLKVLTSKILDKREFCFFKLLSCVF